MGASFLPVTVHNGIVMFLFGKERDIDENPGWADFGGGKDDSETFIQTAAREGSEELTGFLGGKEDIMRLFKMRGTYNVEHTSKGYPTYRCHICPIKYDPLLTFYYNNNQRFLQQKLDPNIIRKVTIFEKTEIKWFTFEDLKRQKRIFRKWYQNIIQQIIDDRDNIERFVKNKQKSKQKSKTRQNKTKYNTMQTKNKTRQNKFNGGCGGSGMGTCTMMPA